MFESLSSWSPVFECPPPCASVNGCGLPGTGPYLKLLWVGVLEFTGFYILERRFGIQLVHICVTQCTSPVFDVVHTYD